MREKMFALICFFKTLTIHLKYIDWTKEKFIKKMHKS